MALTTEEQAAAALGFAMPEGTHFIRNGDDAIRKNAVKAVEYARTAGISEGVPAQITSLDTLTTPGDYQIYSNNDATRIALESWPAPFRDGTLNRSAANVTVRKAITNFAWQELRVWDRGKNRVWIRQTNLYNDKALAFNEWSEIATVDPAKAPRVLPFPLTTSVDGYITNNAANNYRIPFKLPVTATRFRIHVANRNDASGAEYAVPNLRWNKRPVIGEHKLVDGQHTGQFATAPFAADLTYGFPLPNHEEFVGSWMETKLEAGKEYLFSFSYYNPDGGNITAGLSGSWVQAATGLTDALDVPGLTYQAKTPFIIWLELETPHDTKSVAFIGDSLMVGRDARAPLYDSPAMQKAHREGFLPRIQAIAGSRLKQWAGDESGPRWARYSALGRADSVVIELGSNDFFDLETYPSWDVARIVDEMQRRLEQVVNIARRDIADEVYLTTILPRNNKEYPARSDEALALYNSWLQSLPFGAAGCFDWAGAVSDASRARLLRHYVADDAVHLTTAGYSAVAAAGLNNRPASGGSSASVAADPRVASMLVRLQALEAKLDAPPPAPEAPPVQDTGWLNITPLISSSPQLATSKHVGTWQLRRRGDFVLLEVTGFVTDRAGFSHATSEFAGFNGLWVEERSKPGDGHITGAITKNRLWVNSLISNNSSAMHFRLQWLTADPWPNTLPA